MELLENYTLFSELGEEWSVKTTLYGDDFSTEVKYPPEPLLPGGGPDGSAVEWESFLHDFGAPECQVVEHGLAQADTSAQLSLTVPDQDFVVNELHALLAPSEAEPLDVDSLLHPVDLTFDNNDYDLGGANAFVEPLGSDDSSGSSSGVSSPSATSGCSSVAYDSDCEMTEPRKARASKAARGSRSRPYDGLPKEKKDKKKLQNKNAATRYRLKKKAEDLIFQADVQLQTERNRQLKEKVASLEQEIALCKDIMAHIFGSAAV